MRHGICGPDRRHGPSVEMYASGRCQCHKSVEWVFRGSSSEECMKLESIENVQSYSLDARIAKVIVWLYHIVKYATSLSEG